MKLCVLIGALLVSISDPASASELKPRDDGKCGPAHGDPPCKPGNCCSTDGYCGNTDLHCTTKCAYGCPLAKEPRSDGRCGTPFKNAPCKEGNCCSEFGYCGSTEVHCGKGCVYGCDKTGKPSLMSITSPQPSLSAQETIAQPTSSVADDSKSTASVATATVTATAAKPTETAQVNWKLKPRADGKCGQAFGNPPCKCGNVCSKWNACGNTSGHFNNCQYQCNPSGPCPTSSAASGPMTRSSPQPSLSAQQPTAKTTSVLADNNQSSAKPTPAFTDNDDTTASNASMTVTSTAPKPSESMQVNWNLKPRADSKCGPAVGNPPCKCGNVCSKWNACGNTSAHLNNCQYQCNPSGPCPSSSLASGPMTTSRPQPSLSAQQPPANTTAAVADNNQSTAQPTSTPAHNTESDSKPTSAVDPNEQSTSSVSSAQMTDTSSSIQRTQVVIATVTVQATATVTVVVANPTDIPNWKTQPRSDGLCGAKYGNPPCKCGHVCSKWNSCGETKTHRENCQYQCDPAAACPIQSTNTVTNPAPTPSGVWPKYNRDGVVQTCKTPGLVALTFHGPPDSAESTKILELFERGGHKATFFWYGEAMNTKRDYVREVVGRGHEVGLRGWKRRPLVNLNPKVAMSQIDKTQKLFEKVTNVGARFFRAPEFRTNRHYEDLLEVDQLIHVAANMQLHHKLRVKPVQTIVEAYEDNMECANPSESSFIISHSQEVNLSLLEQALNYIKWAGYKLVTLQECLKEPAYRQLDCE